MALILSIFCRSLSGSSKSRKPPNQYLLFLEEFLSSNLNSESKRPELVRKAGELWKSMSESEKSPYSEKYKFMYQKYLENAEINGRQKYRKNLKRPPKLSPETSIRIKALKNNIKSLKPTHDEVWNRLKSFEQRTEMPTKLRISPLSAYMAENRLNVIQSIESWSTHPDTSNYSSIASVYNYRHVKEYLIWLNQKLNDKQRSEYKNLISEYERHKIEISDIKKEIKKLKLDSLD